MIDRVVRFAAPHAALDLADIGWQFIDERAGDGVGGPAPEFAQSGVRQLQFLHRAGHAHKTQPPFFLQFQLVVQAAFVGQQALFQCDHEHHGEFQTLGGVHGHDGHAFLAGVEPVQVAGQRDVLKESGNIVGRVQLRELPRRRDQFLDVGQVVLIGVVGLFQRRLVTRLVQHLDQRLVRRAGG